MELARLFNGKKFMWDGRTYDNESDSRNQEQRYRAIGFEVRSCIEDDKHYLFTRRVISSAQG